YDQQEYAEARDGFDKLSKDFPASRDVRKYRFLAELSGVRAEAIDARKLTDLGPALEHVQQFMGYNQNDPLLKDRHPDVWETLHLLAVRLTAEAESQHADTALELARKAWSE